jgi:hypothetical protein
MRYTKVVVCLVATLCTGLALAEVPATQTGAADQVPSGSPIAFVYVSSSPTSNNYEINAFAVASNGKLTAVSGSPFRVGFVAGMAVNPKYLFLTDAVYIYSFSIAPDGTIKQVASINAQQFNNPSNYGGPRYLFLDRSGANVYDTDLYCCGDDNALQFFNLEASTGELSFIGVTTATWSYYEPLSFIGNSVYGYASECSEYSDIYGFQRDDNGTLSALNINPLVPTAPKGYSYCPNQIVGDSANHLAMALTPSNAYNSPGPPPPPQLATYTADSSGNITTRSTRFNMPKTAIPVITDIAMSPSGKLLAVAGLNGLQVFHFNGSKPLTHYTGLLTLDQIDQVYWDNDNHLYAISQPSGKLFVYTVTPDSVSQAPGSPHKITQPQNIVVLSK